MTQSKIPVAIQLYSLRQVIADDVEGTLEQLAAMGYDGVEFAGYYGCNGEELRALLDRYGLRCAGSHVGLSLLEGDALDPTVDVNRALGTDRLIIPNAPLDDLDDVIRRMNAVHEAAKAQGMRSGYHNHTQEFEPADGQTRFERIFDATPNDFLVQVDIGWAYAAGQDVPALLRAYGDRIETVHVKEFDPNDRASVVGEGTVDWPPIFDLLESETRVQWYIVEQEQAHVGPMESARECIENIRKMGR